MANTLLVKFNLWKYNNTATFTLIINYLFVLYAFFIPLSEKVLNIILLLIILFSILDSSFISKVKIALKNRLIQSFLLFYLIHFLWLFGSDDKDFALETIKNSMFFLYAIVFAISISKEFIFKILNGFLYSMMFNEFISYLIFYQIISPINNATIENPVPFVLSHTQYALYLGISMALILYQTIQNKTTLARKIIYGLFFMTSSYNIFIISSRLGFILYAVNIFIIVTLIYKKDFLKSLKILFITIVLGYTLAYNFSSTFEKRTKQTIESIQKVLTKGDYSTSLGTRIGHWVYSYDVIKDNFIFGVGDGDQKLLVQENIKQNEQNLKTANILICNTHNGLHSDFLDYLVKFGVIGLLFYLNIFYQLSLNKPKHDIFNGLKYLLIISFFLSGLQGGTIMLRDLGTLFVLLSILVIKDSTTSLDTRKAT